MPLPSIDVASQQRNSRFIRQRTPGGSQFVAGTVVVLVGPIQMLGEGKMSLPRGRAQLANRLDGRFGQLKARIGVIETEEINAIIRSRELSVGIKEQGIARNSLIEESNRFE